MSIRISTADPDKLLKLIKARINQKESAGKIKTWSVDDDGDFTFLADQYLGDAWFRPKSEPENKRLIFSIWPPEAKKLSWDVWATYHGHFVRMLFAHFGDKIISLDVAQRRDGDRVDGRRA